jgi:3-oxosteroid 1-dehydrogenase
MRTDADVVVLGSGCAALAAAVTASECGSRVALYEKAQRVGGTSAWSGGQVWIPNNRQMKELGKSDSTEEAVTYLMSMSNGLIDPHMSEAFWRRTSCQPPAYRLSPT